MTNDHRQCGRARLHQVQLLTGRTSKAQFLVAMTRIK